MTTDSNKFRQPRPPRAPTQLPSPAAAARTHPLPSARQSNHAHADSARSARPSYTAPTPRCSFPNRNPRQAGGSPSVANSPFSLSNRPPSPLLDITRITVPRSPLSTHSAIYYETPGRVGSAEYGRPLAGDLPGGLRSYSRPKDAHPLLSILMGAVAVLPPPGAEPECLEVVLEMPFLIRTQRGYSAEGIFPLVPSY